MISIADYTTADEIRAVLGVDSIELNDETLALPVYAQALQIKLSGFTGTFGATTGTVMTIYDVLTSQASMTADEENFVITVKQLATLILAETCCSGLSMFALKTDSDGKASQGRFASEATFRDVVAHVRGRLASVIGTLDYIMSGSYTYATPGISTIVPDTDRVTNE